MQGLNGAARTHHRGRDRAENASNITALQNGRYARLGAGCRDVERLQIRMGVLASHNHGV